MNFTYLLLLLSGVRGAKILVINTLPTFNHFNLVFRLVEVLSKRNHNVTFISPYPHNKTLKNMENILVDGLFDEVQSSFIRIIDKAVHYPLKNVMVEYPYGLKYTEKFLRHESVQEFLESDREFDVVIIEHFFNEALLGMGNRFKAPVVLLSLVKTGYRNNFLFANPEPSFYLPSLHGACYKSTNFWQRLEGFSTKLAISFLREFYYLPRQRTMFQEYFKTNLNLDDAMYNISLMLSNSQMTINTALPQVPNIINIGGYHIKPQKKISEEIQNYLDQATDGFILFSLGTGVKSEYMKPEVKRGILNTFAKMKQKVLWKFESIFEDLPENVKIVKWLPQQDILAHRNIRAFVTHGGATSLIETVYFGVPIVGIPIFSDQFSNVDEAENHGYAVKIYYRNFTEEAFSGALQEVIFNPKYKENAQKLSKLFHDQPVKPMNTAIYWVEHVIRHKGALHLQFPEVSLLWYQRKKIDILFFLFIIVVVLITVIHQVKRRILRIQKLIRKPSSNVIIYKKEN